MPPAVLEAKALAKAFGETKALTSCSLRLTSGEIHALCGENGSGKSTFVKILAGVLRPDAGELELRGARVIFRSPRDSLGAGIATVFQETLVVPDMSVRDNLLMGVGETSRRKSADPAALERVVAAMERLGVKASLEAPIWSLSLAQQQLITIARALARQPAVLVLDESTSALDIDDVERLFDALRMVKALGVTVLYISHRMEEIKSVADRLTVLRAGQAQATLAVADAPTDLVLRLMTRGFSEDEVGQGTANLDVMRQRYKRGARRSGSTAETAMEATDVVLSRGAEPFRLEVKAGEILGVIGLEGHGQSEFLETVVGLRRPHAGRVAISGERGLVVPRSLRAALRQGVAYVPRSRKDEGLFGPMSVLDNLLLPSLSRLGVAGFLPKTRLRRSAQAIIRDMQIKTRGTSASITSLSGGNQQKVLLGRWITTEPKMLVLNDPLRGVDLGAKLDLYAILRDLADRGMTLVFLSSEVEELLLIADRVAVFHAGALFSALDAEGLTSEEVVAAMFGRFGAVKAYE